MNNFKVRAWEESEKRFLKCIVGNSDKDDNDWICPLVWTGNDWLHSDTCNVVIFTGLQDIHGKDIYEGDIVKHIHRYTTFNGREHEVHRLYEVHWGTYADGEYVDAIECWMIGNDSLSDIILSYTNDKHSIEIIGNIFENKELLEDE